MILETMSSEQTHTVLVLWVDTCADDMLTACLSMVFLDDRQRVFQGLHVDQRTTLFTVQFMSMSAAIFMSNALTASNVAN